MTSPSDTTAPLGPESALMGALEFLWSLGGDAVGQFRQPWNKMRPYLYPQTGEGTIFGRFPTGPTAPSQMPREMVPLDTGYLNAVPSTMPRIEPRVTGFIGQPGRMADVVDEFGNPISDPPFRPDTYLRKLDQFGSQDLGYGPLPRALPASVPIESQAPPRSAPPSIASQAPTGPRPIASGAPVPYEDPVRRALQMITVGRNTAL